MMHKRLHKIEEERTKVRGRINSRRKGEVLVILEDPESDFMNIEWLDEEEVDIEHSTEVSAYQCQQMVL